MEANRHGRYHRRQPPEKQINFFPSISTLHPARWAAFLKWCAGLLVLMWAVSQISEGREIDSGDDEEILMHIYQLIKGQSQQASAFPPRPSLPLLFCRSHSLHCSCLRLEIPPLFSHERLLCSLSFMPWRHLPHVLFFNHTVWLRALPYLQLHVQQGGEGWGTDADSLLLLQFHREVTPPEQSKI